MGSPTGMYSWSCTEGTPAESDLFTTTELLMWIFPSVPTLGAVSSSLHSSPWCLSITCDGLDGGLRLPGPCNALDSWIANAPGVESNDGGSLPFFMSSELRIHFATPRDESPFYEARLRVYSEYEQMDCRQKFAFKSEYTRMNTRIPGTYFNFADDWASRFALLLRIEIT